MSTFSIPDKIHWSTGVINNLVCVGKHLRLATVGEASIFMLGDQNSYIDTEYNLPYVSINGTILSFSNVRSRFYYALLQLNDGGSVLFERVATIQRSGNTLVVGSLSIPYDGKLFLASMITNDSSNPSGPFYISTKSNNNILSKCYSNGGGWYYTNSTYIRLTNGRVYATNVLSGSGATQSLLSNIALNKAFYKSGTWTSPIFDFGPYLNITGINVTNVVTDGTIKLYARASSSAPSTGSPTATSDDANNTVYYYGPNETWTASSWQEFSNGGIPAYVDRFMQFKVELIGA